MNGKSRVVITLFLITLFQLASPHCVSYTTYAAEQQTATVTFSVSGVEDVSPAMSILVVDGWFYRADHLPVSFTWEVGSEHGYEWLDVAPSTVEDRRYRLVSVSGLSNSSTGSIIVPADGGYIEAVYKTQYLLTVSAEINKGTTKPPPGMYWFDEWTYVNITAVPAPKYEFKMWRAIMAASATYDPDSNPTTVWMGGPISLVAEFTEAFDYAVSLDPWNVTLLEGESAAVSVYVERTAGEARQKIRLSVVAPEGISWSFKVESDVPPIYTTLTIKASENVPAKTYTLLVRAAYGEIVKEAPLLVAVIEPEKAWYEPPWIITSVVIIIIAVMVIFMLAWKRRI